MGILVTVTLSQAYLFGIPFVSIVAMFLGGMIAGYLPKEGASRGAVNGLVTGLISGLVNGIIFGLVAVFLADIREFAIVIIGSSMIVIGMLGLTLGFFGGLLGGAMVVKKDA